MRSSVLRFALVFCAVILCVSSGASGRAHAALLTVRSAERPVELRALDIEARITGRFAWTDVEMTFYNPNGRIIEGELDFPLENGQSVTGFSLSMGEGKREVMRDAAPVEKQKGRQVFEDVVRKNVDPALLEVTRGNNFKLRVYPLPPGGTRRVRISYSEPLAEKDGVLTYRLPLAYEGYSGKFSMRVTSSGGRPEVSGRAAGAMPIEITGDERSGVFEIKASAENAAFGGGLIVTVGAPGDDEVYFGEHGGRTYFYAQIPGAALSKPEAGAKQISSLSVLWDASASGRARDHSREMDFLAEFFKENRNLSVRLQRARDTAEAAAEFHVANGDWSALREAIESTVYDGATNLGSFDTDFPSDIFLLFSDGLDNYGENPPAVPKRPLYAVISSPGTDASRLEHLALQSGGAMIDLSLSDAKSALETIMFQRIRIASVTGEGAGEIQWAPDAQGGGFTVTGIIDGPSGSIRVVFETPGKGTFTRNIVLRPGRQKSGGGRLGSVPFLWASMRLKALDAEYDLNRGEIRRLGKSFGLATRETSLIVLDRAEDYLRYGIDPPAELRDEYDRLRTDGWAEQNIRERGKLERVAGEWGQREEWWEKDFPKDRMPRKKTDEKRNGSSAPIAMSESYAETESMRLRMDAASVPRNAAPAQEQDISGWSLSGSGGSKPGDDLSGEPAAMSIALRPWSPDSPYRRRMKEARLEDLYRIYLDERPDYENSAAFFLDVSYQLMERGLEDLSMRVLSNLAEMELGNHQILRVLGYRLLEAGRAGQAAVIFRQVLAIADYEPQSYRDLGLAYNAIGESQAAVDMLYEVVERDFGRNFPGIEVIALTEMNAIIAVSPKELDVRKIDPRFIADRPLDLRVVLTWDFDSTDIDLHVTDPNGEEVYYAEPLSYQGGRISPDNTTGYGPEEYSLKVAKPGKYKVDVNFYGHSRQIVSEATTIQLDFFTGYGTKEQKKQSVTMRLVEAKDRIFVGEFDVR
ncbi:MAG: DUF2135 domain-containing protein [Synergistaceae bacterium]|nr:DUF2135 domain-containing protein [Synergistaceae bacterium]